MIAAGEIQKALIRVSELIVEAEPVLTKIDSIIGDGDHGTGMKRGFSAVYDLLNMKSFTTVPDLFYMTGMELLKKMGGASGVLFGSFFISGAKVQFQNEKEITLSEMSLVFRSGTDSIMKRGKAQSGDKTMIDALIPASRAFQEAVVQGCSRRECFERAYKASLQGAQATVEMIPKRGRAKNFRLDAIGYPDPGAISVTYIFGGLKDVLS